MALKIPAATHRPLQLDEPKADPKGVVYLIQRVFSDFSEFLDEASSVNRADLVQRGDRFDLKSPLGRPDQNFHWIQRVLKL